MQGRGEAGIRIDDFNHYVADVAATCAEPERTPYVEEPFLIVEVLSPSTHKDDIAVKVKRYIELPSVREIWLIDSRERWAQVWRREAGAWVVTMPLRGDATFRSEALGEEIALGELYRNSGM
ncbi:MAG TPA: Uma2 family endonuclease [Geminicoccaceae bacterium]|nr:Uma2 family endonuclease [Geminicoccaceae bacterium]